MLKDSVFQNEVLISEEAFARLYPREEGRTIHLVESPTEQIDSIANLMQIGLSKKGPTITRAQDRVAMFMAVENTYLTTFQLLGGFGLVLGALGLASAILRGTWERRAELALLRAVGFRQNAVASLVLWENLFLLALGLGAGIAAALLSVAPHVAAGGSIPLVRLSVLLGLVLLSAFSAALVALRVTLRVPMLPALRRE
jgi:ABC-type antimicrobial peptide transport system permease subunit